jgi:hypothetical protein
MWNGALASTDAFLDKTAIGVKIVYRLDPSLGRQLAEYISTGKEVIGLAQQLAGGSDASKGAALQAVVKAVITIYTGALERMAARSKADKDRILAQARSNFVAGIISQPKGWPYARRVVPHVTVYVTGGGHWNLQSMGHGSKFEPCIYKPEKKTIYRYLLPGPTHDPQGCSADVSLFGSVEGTDDASCTGQVVLYPLLYPCWRERSLSTGGEFLGASDRDDPGAQMLALQTSAILDPYTNMRVPMNALEDVVAGFEDRFWAAVKQRKSLRRDPNGMVGPKPHSGWSSEDAGARVKKIKGQKYRPAGLCGQLGQPGRTGLDANDVQTWANGIQVLRSKPKNPTLDDRFYLDADGIIRAIWNDADLENCYVLAEHNYLYDPDTGDRFRCTISARNSIYATWQNISTAR